MPINSFLYPAPTNSNPYEVANSLRFDDGSSDNLSKTASAGDRRQTTISVWVKRGTLGSQQKIYNHYNSTNSEFTFYFDSNDKFNVNSYESGHQLLLTTNRLFRDVSAWYNIICAIDTDQATDTNRAKIYVNGVQETSFATSTYPSQNADLNLNRSTSYTDNIGRRGNGSEYFDGYLAEVVLVDGQQLDATSFGKFDFDTNIWIPKEIQIADFGTNGFYLDFEDSSALGNDVSGNNNDFTVNNLTSIDQTTDTCTNNFATLNTLRSFEFTFSEGNLVATSDQPSDNRTMALSSFAPESGKWYAEVKVSTVGAMMIGLYATDGSQIDGTDRIYSSTGGIAYFATNGSKYIDGNVTSYGASYTTNDIIGIALNMDDEEVTFYKNNVSQGAISLTSGKIYNMGISAAGTSACVASFNFGNPSFTISSGNADANGYGNFEYAVPSGYFALCTKNLAEYG